MMGAPKYKNDTINSKWNRNTTFNISLLQHEMSSISCTFFSWNSGWLQEVIVLVYQ